MEDKFELQPNKALSSLLAGKREITLSTANELDGLAEVLAQMEDMLFSTTPAQRAQRAKNRAEMPVKEIIAHFRLDIHYPQTLSRLVSTDDEALLRHRILWLIDLVQSALPHQGEQLTEAYQEFPAGKMLWDICPI